MFSNRCLEMKIASLSFCGPARTRIKLRGPSQNERESRLTSLGSTRFAYWLRLTKEPCPTQEDIEMNRIIIFCLASFLICSLTPTAKDKIDTEADADTQTSRGHGTVMFFNNSQGFVFNNND